MTRPICRWPWILHPEITVQNPLRLLKRGFATYTDADADALAKSGLDVRVDDERDRRLFADEESRILAQRSDSLDERVFFELARDTAIFGAAGVADCRFHDLRHEATSRLTGAVRNEETGLLFPFRNAPVLARALATLLEDADLAACLSENGRRAIEEKFFAVRMARETLLLYQDVLKRKSLA